MQKDERTRKQRGNCRVGRPANQQTETHYDLLGPIFRTNSTKVIDRILMLRVLKTVLRAKTYHS